MRVMLLILAVIADVSLGEPRRWHPLVGFGTYAERLEARFNRFSAQATEGARWRGLLALLCSISPPMLMCVLLTRLPYVGIAVQIGVLYLALGHRSLHEHALGVREALVRSDLASARERVGLIVSRDTAAMQRTDVVLATVESILENGNDAVFGALFWFLVAGAPGALLYRLVNTLDAMWGYRIPRYLYFGWAAARFDDLLNWVPARLTALTYALAGSLRTALRCWREQGILWNSPNAGLVMAAGAGALHVRLGGGAFYPGHWRERPALGVGPQPQITDISRALRLVQRSLWMWIIGAACIQALLDA